MLRTKHRTSDTFYKLESEIQVESDMASMQNEEKHYLENHVNEKDLKVEDNRWEIVLTIMPLMPSLKRSIERHNYII